MIPHVTKCNYFQIIEGDDHQEGSYLVPALIFGQNTCTLHSLVDAANVCTFISDFLRTVLHNESNYPFYSRLCGSLEDSNVISSI